jgi:two-component system, cell cycle sensor histidine kinase and response regulator CckA
LTPGRKSIETAKAPGGGDSFAFRTNETTPDVCALLKMSLRVPITIKGIEDHLTERAMNPNKDSIMPASSRRLHQLNLHPITLSFRGGLEKTFRESYHLNSLRTVRLSLASGIIMYGFFGILDAVLIPEMIETLWLIRFAFVCPFLLATIALSYLTVFKTYFQFAMAAAMIVSGIGIIYMIAILPPPINHAYYAGLILVLIWGYTFTRVRFVWATSAGWVVVLTYQIVVTQVIQIPYTVLMNNNFFLISSNVAGMFACYFIELYTRRDFFHAISLEKEQEKVKLINRRLEKIVAERTAQLLTKNKELSEEIDERKRAEKERADLESRFQHAQKMEAIGTLAGGVAHDFNNLLMAIQGNTSLMLLQMQPDNPCFEKLKNIEQYVMRGSELTRQLLGFARRGKYQANATNLNLLITECSTLFGRTNKKVSIRLELEEKPWVVNIDRGQIEQVLLNLFVNAWQAMPGGGRLTIKTQNVTVDEGKVKGHESKPGNYVRTSVADEGIGMDEKTMQRIFDPFFTTKEMGRGTGMGLASAYGIMQNHGGFFEVESQAGKGSTLSFFLPASPGPVQKESPPEPGQMMKGSETIMIVDDEDIVVDVASEMLNSLGYKVLVAMDGHEALEIYSNQKENVSLVILDLIMPGLSGSHTFDLLKKENPAVKVLLSSGYSLSGEASSIMDKGCLGFIQKPYDIFKLSQKIKEVLNSHPAELTMEL